MDADHRHELKENDLAEFLGNFGPWWAKHGNTLLIAVLVVAAVFFGKRFIESRNAAVLEEAWADLAQATSPESYRLVAQSHELPAVRALADLRGADLWLAKAAAPMPDTEPTPQGSQAATPVLTAEQFLDEAAMVYGRVANDPQAHLVFKLNAHLGLAAVAESRQDWAQAQQQYTWVTEHAGPGYKVIAAQAKARQGQLDRLKRPVVFGPDPDPPATEPTASDTLPDLDLPSFQPGDSDIAAPIDITLP